MKGAFTDARSNRRGKIAEADDGILFFDEIGEMPLNMQAKMLRIIQHSVYSPVGSEREQQINCRFIFATNRNLEKMIGEGLFREDLFYRINVLLIDIPPLRERKSDVPLLVSFLFKKYTSEFGFPVQKINSAAMNLLSRYDWPGNVRELENVLIRSLAETNHSTITVQDITLPETNVYRESTNGYEPPRQSEEEMETEGDYKELLKKYKRKLLISGLIRANGNKTKAATMMGLKRTTLNFYIREVGINEKKIFEYK